jgi:hypothetical protein
VPGTPLDEAICVLSNQDGAPGTDLDVAANIDGVPGSAVELALCVKAGTGTRSAAPGAPRPGQPADWAGCEAAGGAGVSPAASTAFVMTPIMRWNSEGSYPVDWNRMVPSGPTTTVRGMYSSA